MSRGPLCVVFLAGDNGDPGRERQLAEQAAIRLAADGGARRLLELGVLPDAVVGDFDSLAADDLARLEASGVELQRHPVRKDLTDGELVVEEALRRGAGEVVLLGGTGALDHTLGHLAILTRLAARGVAARLVAQGLAVRVLVGPAEACLDAGPGTRVSVVPIGGDATVTLTGLDYPLDHGILPATACLGLGNRVAAPGPARIAVHAGSVAVLVGADDESFAGPAPAAGPA